MRRPVGIVLLLTATTLLAACTSGSKPAAHSSAPPSIASSPSSIATPSTTGAMSSVTPTPRATTSTKPKPSSRPHTTKTTVASRSSTPAPSTSHRSTTTPAKQESGALPLSYPTGNAAQVVTVTTGAQSNTQATLQAWRRSGSGWAKVGPAIAAYLGTAGMTTHPSEQTSATPMGSYTLTQAFGHDPNPGTTLPYRQTTPADWWISQSGPLYNTLQHCSSNCSFAQGDPNEHLYYETPYYDYAMVIDYNRAPVRQGAGSAFFVHVSVGAPTAGCVSIPKDQLVTLMRWIRPADHPRILIGTV